MELQHFPPQLETRIVKTSANDVSHRKNEGGNKNGLHFSIHGSIPMVWKHQGLDNAFVYIFVCELVLRVVTERQMLRGRLKGPEYIYI